MTQRPVVCPFCPLGCDDLVVRDDGAVAVECRIAIEQFAAAIQAPAARFAREIPGDASLEEAIGNLTLPEVPVVAVEQPTLSEAKLLDDLASAGKLVLDPGISAQASALSHATARDGAIGVTLGDAMRFGDLFLVVGDVQTETPRLLERLASTSANLIQIQHLNVDQIARLQRLGWSGDAAEGDSQRNSIDQAILKARYVVVVLGSGAFLPGEETVAAEWLLRWVTRWNECEPAAERPQERLRRAAMLQLAPQQSLHHVLRFRNNRVADHGLSTLPPISIRLGSRPRNESSVAMSSPVALQIGGSDPGPELASAYLPAAMPGVHRADATIRGDGSVTLPLASIVTSELPSRIEWLQRVLQRSR